MSDLISRKKICDYIKGKINPYGKPFEGTAYELGLKIMRYINAMDSAYSVDKVISQLGDYGNEEIEYYRNTPYENCIRECISKAIEIVKQSGDADDNCKWSQISTARYETSCGYKLVEFFDTNACYCKQCGKKIKIVGD